MKRIVRKTYNDTRARMTSIRAQAWRETTTAEGSCLVNRARTIRAPREKHIAVADVSVVGGKEDEEVSAVIVSLNIVVAF